MQEVDLQKKSRELAVMLDEYIRDHFESLTAKFLECFSAYCRKISRMQRQGKKGPVAYIHFSVLRTNVLLNRHEIRMDAYDENWYLDREECSGSYPVEEFYCFLEKFGEAVEELRTGSGGGVSLAQAQKRVFDESKLYLLYLAEFIRLGMRQAVLTEDYRRMERAPCFTVAIGGYLDRFDILYREDHTQKEGGQVKRRFQKASRFSYEICENLDLSGGDYEGLEFQYSSFEGCDFTGSSFHKGNLLFCNFKGAMLKDVNMEKVKIFDADFSGATLEGVSFAGAKLKHISFAGARLVGVDFEKALLAEEMDFGDARIEDCRIPKGGGGWITLS